MTCIPYAWITYTYDYNRLTGIVYPENPEQNVSYEYGPPQSGNQSGRMIHVEDASGMQELEYGKMGEHIAQTRQYVFPGGGTYQFKTLWEYDSWNRIKNITYPDGEVENYSYNDAGKLKAMNGTKGVSTYSYIKDIRYNQYGSRVFIKYGNDNTAAYTYNAQNLRLTNLKSYCDAGNTLMQDINYNYDNAGNITLISNAATAVGGMGGQYTYAYTYDNLYRLSNSSGSSGNNSLYSLAMQYSANGKINNKTVTAHKNLNGTSQTVNYAYNYTYNSELQPNTLSTVEDAVTGLINNYTFL